jgi:hypothetical protein
MGGSHSGTGGDCYLMANRLWEGSRERQIGFRCGRQQSTKIAPIDLSFWLLISPGHSFVTGTT